MSRRGAWVSLVFIRVYSWLNYFFSVSLIPLWHPLTITHCEVTFAIPARRDRVVITASAKIAAQTGVEMEALTIYDMCKAVDRAMVISDVRLVRKAM